jgi:hypothetical protein
MDVRQQLEIAQQRLSICLGCDRLQAETGSCIECTCDVYDKVRLVGTSCPIGKWQSHDWTI